MPPLAIGGAISAGTSLLGGLLGQSAASKAAAAQAAAGKAAAGLAATAGQNAQDAQSQQITSERANAQPFVGAGQGTINSLSQLLQPGGDLTKGYGTFSAPTAAEAEQTPGYQFQLSQGINALQNSAAARGGLLSTGTAKNLNNYAQGTAASNYQNVYNNALQGYNANFNTFNSNQNNLYNRLMGVSTLGANSASALNNVTQSGTANLTGDLLSTAQMQGNDLMGVGNAQAGGIVGGNNALVGGLSGAANQVSQGLTLSQLLGAKNASGSYAQQMPYNPSTAFPGRR